MECSVKDNNIKSPFSFAVNEAVQTRFPFRHEVRPSLYYSSLPPSSLLALALEHNTQQQSLTKSRHSYPMSYELWYYYGKKKDDYLVEEYSDRSLEK